MAQWPFKGRRGNKQTTITSSTAEIVIIPAYTNQSGEPISADVYALILANSSATNTKVTINDASSGTKRFVFAVPAHDTKIFTLPKDAAHQQSVGNNNWTAQCADQVDSIDITALFEANS